MVLEKGLSGCLVENRIHVVPPAAIGDADAHRGLDELAEVLPAEAARG